MSNGEKVAEFERAFAERFGAEYAIGMCNGTATLHTALAALGVTEGTKVAVPPLTMASTTLAVLHAGGAPVFVDVDPDTWLMKGDVLGCPHAIAVALYGLRYPGEGGMRDINDAAQTLQPHSGCAFTSYSFQASKHLALGEGGMLVTNDPELARRARSFSSLGYDMSPDTSRIDPARLKASDYSRHYAIGWNYRMADAVAALGLEQMEGGLDDAMIERTIAAEMYQSAILGCDWITPQKVPEGSTHDYWCFAVALDSPDLVQPLSDAVVRHGGERPYGAWRLTYQEPALAHLGGSCPVAEDLQPRLLQFQTNDLEAIAQNAVALDAAIREIGG